MLFLVAAVAAGIAYVNRESLAGKLGELKTPKDAGSAEFKKRQAIREYNALLDRTDPTAPPSEGACMACIAAGKAKRRKDRHDLIRKAQSKAQTESDPVRKRQVLAAADGFAKDMDRVEDAKLALHTYTANEDLSQQQGFLSTLRDQAPPGFKMASVSGMADDFGVNPGKLKKLLNSAENPTQKIMVYERDEAVLGPGPKYTVAFRGSTTDPRDWNNNGRNEAGFEAPHQKNAARLGAFLEEGAANQGKSIGDLVSATGHSKGGSEAQSFGAASGASVRGFNPAGFDPKSYGMPGATFPFDRTSVITRDAHGRLIESTASAPSTDPLYFAQHAGASQYVMKKPVMAGSVRELAPIDPNLSLPSVEQSDSEAHSMLQVVEALERDKEASETTLKQYLHQEPSLRLH